MRAVIKVNAAPFRQVRGIVVPPPSVDSREIQQLSPCRLRVFAEGRRVRMRDTGVANPEKPGAHFRRISASVRTPNIFYILNIAH